MLESEVTGRLSALPPAHELLGSPAAKALSAALPHDAVRALVRKVLAELRDELLAGRVSGEREYLTERAGHLLAAEARRARVPKLRRVINATGVVIHTNLGRAPLGPEVADHVAAIARGLRDARVRP